MIRVAMVQGTAEPERDGVADYVCHLTGALRALGTRVEPVQVGVGAGGVVRAARRLRALAPDLVHVQFAPSAFGFSPWPGLLPDLVGAPAVVTLHEYGGWSVPSWVPGPVWRAVERAGVLDRETWRWVPTAAAAVTTNAGHATVLSRRFGRRAVRVPLAPNVPDCGDDMPRGATRARLGVPPDAQVVAFFGFVHPVKGVRYLVEALPRLPASVHLLVLGGFTSMALPENEARAFRAALTDVIDRCGVTGRVTITGRLPAAEVSAALHASDLAAFPFTAGATTKSGALLSAFAHGLPTVVTAADPPDPELVDGETVVVAPRVRDAGSLVEALGRLLDDAPLRERIAAGGSALAADRSWPRIAQAHRALYAGVLDGGRNRHR